MYEFCRTMLSTINVVLPSLRREIADDGVLRSRCSLIFDSQRAAAVAHVDSCVDRDGGVHPVELGDAPLCPLAARDRVFGWDPDRYFCGLYRRSTRGAAYCRSAF